MKVRILAALGAVVTLSVSFVAGVNPAHATFPGREGLVAYVKAAKSHSDIWIGNTSNGTKKKLTSQGHNNWPRWSADGKHIAYSNSGELWVMNADGTGKREVSAPGDHDLKPAWSPDGKQLVFIRIQPDGRGDLFRMPSAGGTATRLTDDTATTGGDDLPTWSPNGKQILFEQINNGATSIKYMSSTGGTEYIVPAAQESTGYDAGTKPDWAPDGRHIFFLAYCNADDGGCVGSYNVNVSTLTSPTRTQLTGYDGFDEDTSLDDYATAPDAKPTLVGFQLAAVVEQGFDIRTQKFAFIGLEAGSFAAAGAINPDWQPVS